MTFRLNLTGPPPWGFRICGGRDFKMTLTVSKEPSVRPKQTHESGQGQSKSSSQSFRAPLERNSRPEQLKQHDKESIAGHNSASDCIQTVSYESQTTKKKVSFNYPVWSYGPVDPEELMRIKRRQVQPQQPRQSNTFRILQEGLERTSLPSGAVQRSQRFRTCERCGYIIVTQVVKIREALQTRGVLYLQRLWFQSHGARTFLCG
ncbi:hypothetical protein G5714_011185 [Onychostoma macrolepis]|uniref:Uncharacterized protein n=1 Tax=Onychostoma macrolepis TaxID=369639 RepID=A0A7J6CML5_9TELE|nr:hypothetical protein G5714_011185 [Onychostoma macrolepis]